MAQSGSGRPGVVQWVHSIVTVLAALAGSYVFFGEFRERLEKDVNSQIGTKVKQSVQDERAQIDAQLQQIAAMRRDLEADVAAIRSQQGEVRSMLQSLDAELRSKVEEAVGKVNSKAMTEQAVAAAQEQVKRDVVAAAAQFERNVQELLARLETEIPLISEATESTKLYDALARDEAYRDRYFRWLLDPGKNTPYDGHTIRLPSGKQVSLQKWADLGGGERRLTSQEIMSCGVVKDFDIFTIIAAGGTGEKYCVNDRPPLDATDAQRRILFNQLRHLLPRWKELGVVH